MLLMSQAQGNLLNAVCTYGKVAPSWSDVFLLLYTHLGFLEFYPLQMCLIGIYPSIGNFL